MHVLDLNVKVFLIVGIGQKHLNTLWAFRLKKPDHHKV